MTEQLAMGNLIPQRRRLIERFQIAWEQGDVDGLMSLMSSDAEFRASIGPEPGRTYRGPEEIEAGFRSFLTPGITKSANVVVSELISSDFAVTRWTSQSTDRAGTTTHTYGCDVFEFSGDRISLKDTYRKVIAAP